MTNTAAYEALAERMTLADLAKFTGVPVGEIIERVVLDAPKPLPALSNSGETRAPVRRVVVPRAAKAEPAKKGEVNTRSQAGREAYDEAVAEHLRKAKKPCGAVEIRAAVGGTPEQFRASINRWIDAGEASYEGQARSTKYIWVGD